MICLCFIYYYYMDQYQLIIDSVAFQSVVTIIMQKNGTIFYFAMRFHPDVVDLRPSAYRHHCYVTLLQRDPESEYEHLSLTHEQRVALWSDTIKSAEFGGTVPVREDHINRICRSLGWAPSNSAAHYGLCYSAAVAMSFSDFVDRVAHSLLTNSISRSDMIALFDTSADPLINTLMDGLVDLATETAIVRSELTDANLRLAALEKQVSDVHTKGSSPATINANESTVQIISPMEDRSNFTASPKKSATKLPVRK